LSRVPKRNLGCLALRKEVPQYSQVIQSKIKTEGAGG
jgi:hypothetical protein